MGKRSGIIQIQGKEDDWSQAPVHSGTWQGKADENLSSLDLSICCLTASEVQTRLSPVPEGEDITAPTQFIARCERVELASGARKR